MQHYFAHRQQGFTLIEIIIVAVIMMIVVAGSIAAFVGFQDRQTALVAAKDVQQLMRTAQTKARARETPSSGCLLLDGYRVEVTANSSSLAPVCKGTSGSVIQRINHPGLATDGAGTYLFHTLEGGVTTPNGTPINTTTLIFKSGATTYSFSISATGAISNVTSLAGNTDL